MKITQLAAIAFLCFFAFGCQPEAEVVEVQEYTIEQFIDNLDVFGGSVSHDNESVLVTSNKSGIFNAYSIPFEGGEMTPLTNSENSSIFTISYFPNDKRVLFRSDDNGNEIFHLFVRNEDGTVTDLTPDSTARASFYGWAQDGNSFFYGSNVRDPRLMDIYEMPLESMEATMIYQNDEAYNFQGLSNDKKYIAFSKSINTNDSDLFLYDRDTKEMTKLSVNQASHNMADFAPDNQSVYYLTNDGSEFVYLMQYDLESGDRTKVMEEDWDISYAYFSHGGKYRIVGINADGKTVVKLTDAEGKAVDFPSFPNGDITTVRISRNEEVASFNVGTSTSPSNLYTYDFASGKYHKLTETLNPEIDESDLVSAEVVRFPSFDEVTIPAIYYKPKQASADNPVPALVWVHGGPGGQSRQSYFPLIQYLVNHGYAVLAVNNRGSSGYGKTFFRMDDQNHGEADLMDCVYGKKWLQTQDYVDSTKIGIIGGSYGGFMVMAALTRTPEEFDVGVNIFGVTNWIRTLRNIPPWWESFREALYEEMGNPNTADSVRLYEISPVFHGDKVVKPTMVLQGAKDPRVLQVESDEMVAAVRANGTTVEYVLFEDEGHGFVKKENEIEGYGKVLEFLEKHLRKVEPVEE